MARYANHNVERCKKWREKNALDAGYFADDDKYNDIKEATFPYLESQLPNYTFEQLLFTKNNTEVRLPDLVR